MPVLALRQISSDTFNAWNSVLVFRRTFKTVFHAKIIFDLTCKCKCIRNWPLPIGAFQDQSKQIVINKHNLVKNPNWQEADQLAIYKRRREVELGATENNIS